MAEQMLHLSYFPPKKNPKPWLFDSKGKPLRLLFVGDSIAVGVGAKVAAPLQADDGLVVW